MKRVSVIILAGLVLLGTALALILSFYSFKLQQETKALHEKLLTYETRDTHIQNMEKTLKVVYDLSDYEAHYYSIMFDDFSAKYRIPWEAYPALVRIESNFNPTLCSPKKAKGMTQVLEGTARPVADKMGIRYNEAILWNEVLNMSIGFTYFSEGFQEKKDDPENVALEHAIRRYLGGPDYLKYQDQNKVYVGEYKSTVWQEYIRLSYIYKGILYDQSQTDKKIPPPLLYVGLSWPIEKFWGYFTHEKSGCMEAGMFPVSFAIKGPTK